MKHYKYTSTISNTTSHRRRCSSSKKKKQGLEAGYRGLSETGAFQQGF